MGYTFKETNCFGKLIPNCLDLKKNIIDLKKTSISKLNNEDSQTTTYQTTRNVLIQKK